MGGRELVPLRCNRDFTSAESYGLGWYKYAIATQWYQFHTTDARTYHVIIKYLLISCVLLHYYHIEVNGFRILVKVTNIFHEICDHKFADFAEDIF